MSIDARAFRQTVGHFVTGVTVIATEIDGSIRAMTANSFTSLSLDPPLVLFCVGKETRMGQIIESATGFSVNILQQDQQHLSTYFAGAWKADAPPVFNFDAWEGGPLLDGSIAALGCTIHAIHEGGDHWIVVGRVRSLYRNENASAPLVFCAGKYTALATPAEVP
jgi:3-hydroxy-9,10-secoandrosta-1,3,5(10)-triene-9,17-dione monooxygenase reductase component